LPLTLYCAFKLMLAKGKGEVIVPRKAAKSHARFLGGCRRPPSLARWIRCCSARHIADGCFVTYPSRSLLQETGSRTPGDDAMRRLFRGAASARSLQVVVHGPGTPSRRRAIASSVRHVSLPSALRRKAEWEDRCACSPDGVTGPRIPAAVRISKICTRLHGNVPSTLREPGQNVRRVV
jgi:hypothetical protein